MAREFFLPSAMTARSSRLPAPLRAAYSADLSSGIRRVPQTPRNHQPPHATRRLESDHAAVVLTPDVWMARKVGNGYDAPRRETVKALPGSRVFQSP